MNNRQDFIESGESVSNCECLTYDKLSKHLRSSDDRKRYSILAEELVAKGILSVTGLHDNVSDFEKKYTCNVCGKAFSSIEELILKDSAMLSFPIIKIDKLCRKLGLKERYRGKGANHLGEWVYYDCYFDEQYVRKLLNLPPTIKYFEYNGGVAGQESGFIDELTNDAVIGDHPFYGAMYKRKKIE